MLRELGAATALAAALAGCSGAAHNRSPSGPPLTAVAGGEPAVSPSLSPSPSPTVSVSKLAAERPDVIVNLPATSALRAELLRAYVAARPDVQWREVSGPRRGTLYFAFDTRTRTYWAIAWFDASRYARYQTEVNFQDGMGGGVFIRQSGHAWRAIVHERDNLPCPGEVPLAVLRAWGLRVQRCML